MGPNEFYAIQPAFTGGEISGDVASRVDIEKYQLALLQAENAVIRPYGAVRKRPGLIFCGKCKYSDRKAILYRFDFTVEISYLLEIGHEYIRIWRNGQYLNVELTTPYREADLQKLRFVQSVDVLYICSGDYPVKKLARYADTDWRLNDIDWTVPAFADLNKDEGNTITPSAASGTVTAAAASLRRTNRKTGNFHGGHGRRLDKAQSVYIRKECPLYRRNQRCNPRRGHVESNHSRHMERQCRSAGKSGRRRNLAHGEKIYQL